MSSRLNYSEGERRGEREREWGGRHSDRSTDKAWKDKQSRSIQHFAMQEP